MTAYFVRIKPGPRTYGGHYRSPTDAVFGCMRKDEIDRLREASEGLKPYTERTKAEHNSHKERYRAAIIAIDGPKEVEVAEVTDMRIPKKVHRVA